MSLLITAGSLFLNKSGVGAARSVWLGPTHELGSDDPCGPRGGGRMKVIAPISWAAGIYSADKLVLVKHGSSEGSSVFWLARRCGSLVGGYLTLILINTGSIRFRNMADVYMSHSPWEKIWCKFSKIFKPKPTKKFMFGQIKTLCLLFVKNSSCTNSKCILWAML